MKKKLYILNIILAFTMLVSCQAESFSDDEKGEGTAVGFNIQFSNDGYESDTDISPMSRAGSTATYNDFCYNSSYFIILKKLPGNEGNLQAGKYGVVKLLQNFSNISGTNQHKICKRDDVKFTLPSQVLQPGDYKFITIINGNFDRRAIYDGAIIDETSSILQKEFYVSTRELYIGVKNHKVNKQASLEDNAASNEVIDLKLERYTTQLNMILDPSDDYNGTQQAYSMDYDLTYDVPAGVNYNGEMLNISSRTFPVKEVYFSNTVGNLRLSKYSMLDTYLNAFIVTKHATSGVDVDLDVKRVYFSEGSEDYDSYKGTTKCNFSVQHSKPAHVYFKMKKDGSVPPITSHTGELKTNRNELLEMWNTVFPADKEFIPLNYQAYNEYSY